MTEQEYLEDNIATVAFHLGQPGARISVSYDGGSKLVVDPGQVLAEISRRLGQYGVLKAVAAQSPGRTWHVALSERVMALEAAGAGTLSTAANF